MRRRAPSHKWRLRSLVWFGLALVAPVAVSSQLSDGIMGDVLHNTSASRLADAVRENMESDKEVMASLGSRVLTPHDGVLLSTRAIEPVQESMVYTAPGIVDGPRHTVSTSFIPHALPKQSTSPFPVVPVMKEEPRGTLLHKRKGADRTKRGNSVYGGKSTDVRRGIRNGKNALDSLKGRTGKLRVGNLERAKILTHAKGAVPRLSHQKKRSSSTKKATGGKSAVLRLGKGSRALSPTRLPQNAARRGSFSAARGRSSTRTRKGKSRRARKAAKVSTGRRPSWRSPQPPRALRRKRGSGRPHSPRQFRSPKNPRPFKRPGALRNRHMGSNPRASHAGDRRTAAPRVLVDGAPHGPSSTSQQASHVLSNADHSTSWSQSLSRTDVTRGAGNGMHGVGAHGDIGFRAGSVENSRPVLEMLKENAGQRQALRDGRETVSNRTSTRSRGDRQHSVPVGRESHGVGSGISHNRADREGSVGRGFETLGNTRNGVFSEGQLSGAWQAGGTVLSGLGAKKPPMTLDLIKLPSQQADQGTKLAGRGGGILKRLQSSGGAGGLPRAAVFGQDVKELEGIVVMPFEPLPLHSGSGGGLPQLLSDTSMLMPVDVRSEAHTLTVYKDETPSEMDYIGPAAEHPTGALPTMPLSSFTAPPHRVPSAHQSHPLQSTIMSNTTAASHVGSPPVQIRAGGALPTMGLLEAPASRLVERRRLGQSERGMGGLMSVEPRNEVRAVSPFGTSINSGVPHNSGTGASELRSRRSRVRMPGRRRQRATGNNRRGTTARRVITAVAGLA